MQIKAHAKVNLILELGPKKSSGRYAINFIMQEIDLHDLINIQAISENKIIIQSNDPKVPLNQDNLCYKAAQIIKDISGNKQGVKIEIQKQIPSAGGLGGGSSDAASVITALNKIWNLNFSEDKLIKLVNPVLGTDTCFFLKGNTAKIINNGIEIETIKTDIKLCFVFVLPNIEVPANKTENIYKNFNLEKVTQKPDTNKAISALENNNIQEVSKNLFNSFEYSLTETYKQIPFIKKELIDLGCSNALMCGAGPTVFGICKSIEKAEEIKEKLTNKYPLVFVSKTK